jgi:hypothetical protein
VVSELNILSADRRKRRDGEWIYFDTIRWYQSENLSSVDSRWKRTGRYGFDALYVEICLHEGIIHLTVRWDEIREEDGY